MSRVQLPHRRNTTANKMSDKQKGSVCFIVGSKDLFDREKNPHLKLDAKSILENDKIPKRFIR